VPAITRTSGLREAGTPLWTLVPIPDATVRAEALFASHLQPSEPVTPGVLDDTVATMLHRDGPRECAARMAYEFGEHPDTAVRRMRWARRTISRLATPPVT
jgi:hypothetical protein